MSSSPRILVIDDDPTILDLLFEILASSYHVCVESDCAESADIPVLVLSARPDARAELEREPVQGCMEKPFAIGKLVSAVDQLLQGAGEWPGAVRAA